ncbi:hypothetical protein AVEN_101612-1 [Araneus ventricosus]|uniref:Uncharacterized protein n=1 Tax=Araneus ventricosus TaxID=182803 RepID=A0A4Y2EXL7_ARAVE|nr:hypothetical protein AVEN_101612-1 [Araneus ventricosus]
MAFERMTGYGYGGVLCWMENASFLEGSGRHGNVPTEQYSAVSEELTNERQAEDESDALNLDGEVTKYSDQESNSETDLEDNPVHKEL